jgi:beta-glucosidase
MNSFNEIGGVPATASAHLQREILKGEWGFEGFVVSDWDSIGELVPHGVAVDASHAAKLALAAGSDMDMETNAYLEHLADLVGTGEIAEELIDDAVRRVLRVKFQLGLFDDPYRYCSAEREQELVLSPAHLDAAREVARRSIVLLKNEGDLLPLDKTKGTIAVIGPLAADKDTPLGSWRAKAVKNSAVSLLEGIEAVVGDEVEIHYAEGAPLTVGTRDFLHELEFNHDDRSGFDAAITAARGADAVVIAIGENAFQTGEGRSQVDISLKGVQSELLKAVHAVRLPTCPRSSKAGISVLRPGTPSPMFSSAITIPRASCRFHFRTTSARSRSITTSRTPAVRIRPVWSSGRTTPMFRRRRCSRSATGSATPPLPTPTFTSALRISRWGTRSGST